MQDSKPQLLSGSEEEQRIARKLLSWVNTFPELPVDIVRYESLTADETSMTFSATAPGQIIKEDITGGYEAEYSFGLLYRLKSGTSTDEQLRADELLNKFGDWAKLQRPEIGGGIIVKKIEPTSRSMVIAVYENGDTDHRITMKVTYKVESW